jgi:Mg/Co/Ni transporter MgtE
MIYKQKFYYLCKTPLSAEGPEDVEVVDRADNSNEFPELFQQYEKLRSHAFNEDNLYSIVRADDIYDLIRTGTEKDAKEEAFERAEQEIITNLQHRVMQKDDANARAILKEVHQIEA